MEKTKMNAARFLVSLVAVMGLLLVTVSAADLADVESVEINGIDESGVKDISVIAGETIPVKIVFESLRNASDVRLKLTLEGTKIDSEADVFVGDVESGKRYVKTLNLKVPYELQDEVSDDLSLELKIWNKDFRTELSDVMVLRVQRPSYNVAVMSVSTSQTIAAGETIPVDIVLKNVGYNDLDDLYVTAKITALGIERTGYFGDLVAVENSSDDDDKDTDTVRGRLFMDVPYSAKPGIYNLEVEVKNSDMTLNKVKQIAIENDFAEVAIKSGSNLILVNPTNKLRIYNVVADSPATVSESTIVVPAGSSRTVMVDSHGAESFKVNVFSGTALVGTVDFTGVKATQASSPAMILIVVLAIVFVVLLAVLIVLMTRKPAKEEFGESYY
ncbi:hypothetical protein HY448_00380 [Candidatus Pacearchaeota archaeon]|nr:hypothetical protein [Candidatus Pacearchaeota archaeon]